ALDEVVLELADVRSAIDDEIAVRERDARQEIRLVEDLETALDPPLARVVRLAFVREPQRMPLRYRAEAARSLVVAHPRIHAARQRAQIEQPAERPAARLSGQRHSVSLRRRRARTPSRRRSRRRATTPSR